MVVADATVRHKYRKPGQETVEVTASNQVSNQTDYVVVNVVEQIQSEFGRWLYYNHSNYNNDNDNDDDDDDNQNNWFDWHIYLTFFIVVVLCYGVCDRYQHHILDKRGDTTVGGSVT